ncbi:MAG: hypothetical protein JJ974_04285 [Phycisphaerales bacterium]|nr:hypothetical protein [Phycisphaerales bacterium]
MDHNDHNTNDPTGPGGFMKLAGIEDGEYDALADLFLGDSELAPEPYSQTGTDAVQTSPTRFRSDDSTIDQSMDHHSGHPIEDTLNQNKAATPRPVEVMPRLTGASFPSTNRVPSIEAVLLGHLPVRASLWVRQYACSTARRRDEIIALVRAASGSTSVDLISGTQVIESNECTSLHEALERVNSIADRVILRVDETTEPELLDRAEIDEITILTGADEAAIVASYRLIKTLTSVWDTGELISTPHLRLAVMGATGQQVADASTKLSRAVDAFLDRPIEIIDAAGRIDATATTNIFRDTRTHQATTILNDLIEIGGGEIIERESIGLITPDDAAEMLDESERLEEVATFVEIPSSQIPVQAPVQETPAPQDDSLCSLIQGLTKLETRCPFALDVELCVDQRGDLHLVAGDDHARPMTRLETVRAWVRDHLLLILRAEPKVAHPNSNDRSDDIALHLITDSPQSLRGLIDTEVRMYALAQVKVGSKSARVATPIN